MTFVKFLNIRWPEDAWKIVTVSIKDVQAFRDQLIQEDKSPKTLNRRISSVSSFYKYLEAAAAEMRLPTRSPIPRMLQFVARRVVLGHTGEASQIPTHGDLSGTSQEVRRAPGYAKDF